MSTTARYTEYDPFAWIYNEHWGPHVLRFVPILDALVFGQDAGGLQVLDLCCGTGQLAQHLTGRGMRVTGIDGSEEMLKFARMNAPAAEFILADARDFSLPPVYAVAVSASDSLNHIMELDGLVAAFRNVREALRPDGRFLFDINMCGRDQRNWGGSDGVVRDDHAFIVRRSYDEETRLARFELTIFRHQGAWQRMDLTLTQRWYAEAEILDALAQADFIQIDIFDAVRPPAALPKLPEGRTFLLARK